MSQIVYAVVFANSSPKELNSLWTTRELAEKMASMLNDEDGRSMWGVEELVVRDEDDELLKGTCKCEALGRNLCHEDATEEFLHCHGLFCGACIDPGKHACTAPWRTGDSWSHPLKEGAQ